MDRNWGVILLSIDRHSVSWILPRGLATGNVLTLTKDDGEVQQRTVAPLGHTERFFS